MKRSTDRIISSHAGTLPRPEGFPEVYFGTPENPEEFYRRLPEAIKDVVRRQAEIGIDVINDGEYGKLGGFSNYVRPRLGGLEPRENENVEGFNVSARDQKDFPGFLEMAGPGGFNFRATVSAQAARPDRPRRINAPIFCTAPLTYIGKELCETDIANMKAAMSALSNTDVEGYLPAIAPGTIEHWLHNGYYNSQEEFLFAIADCMHEEYKAIVDSGLILQIDDPDLPDGWQMFPDMSVEDYRKYAQLRVDAMNHALRGIPEDRVRLHICWGSGHGPHKYDIPLKDIIDIVFSVKAECVSIEASNVRHEHEYHVFEDFKLPEGRSLMPGVIGHATDVLEHPELIAERLVRYANLVGRENVIAGTDCGLGSRVGHPEIAWAKLEAMVEGCRIASKRLWG
jgi:5-methyltetrahydropteroyltriglutamate--homocysteine methyltransferase